jgi:hypothetical protein
MPRQAVERLIQALAEFSQRIPRRSAPAAKELIGA